MRRRARGRARSVRLRSVSEHARATSIARTYGLTHVALAVRDPERSARFYGRALGTVVVYRSARFVQVQTPGSRDVLVFQTDPDAAGKAGGIAHFGFRLVSAEEIELAVEAVERAGGTILQHGEFAPGEPFVFFADPDGYEVEIWYEPPTPIDPGGSAT